MQDVDVGNPVAAVPWGEDRPAGGNGRRAVDARRDRSFISDVACCLYLTLAFAGSLAFIMPASIYSVDLIASDRTAQLAQTNDAVTLWTGGGLSSFTGLDSTYEFRFDNNAGNVTTLQLVTGSPSSTALNGPPALAADAELEDYATTAKYTGVGPASGVLTAPLTSTILPTNLTVALHRKSDGAKLSSVTLATPLIYKSSAGAACSGAVAGGGCICSSPWTLNDATNKCESWMVLNAVCVAVIVDNGGGMRLALDTDVGAGCALNPVGIQRNSGHVAYYAPVPQLDACVPSTVNNLGPFGYYGVGQTAPSISPSNNMTISNVRFSIRGVNDPYITALSATRGARDNMGLITFGTPLSSLGAKAAGLWAAFLVCFCLLAMYLTCVCYKGLDGPMDRIYARDFPVVSPVVGFCGSVTAKSRDSKICKKVLPSGIIFFAGFLATCFLAVYIYLAAVLMDAPWVCAYKSVGCTATDVELSCGTLRDLQASSSTGAAFRGLTIAAISLALFPIGVFAAITGVTVVSSGTGAVLFLLVAAAIVICEPFSAILQVAAGALYTANRDKLMAAYCSYITNDILAPSYCKSVPRTDAAMVAQTTIGFFAVLCVVGPVCVWTLMKRSQRSRPR